MKEKTEDAATAVKEKVEETVAGYDTESAPAEKVRHISLNSSRKTDC